MKEIYLPQINRKIKTEDKNSLMKILVLNQIPVASSCGGEGICGKCVMQVESGLNNLTPTTELEKSILQKNNFSKNMRLSCQCQLMGNIEIKTNYW